MSKHPGLKRGYTMWIFASAIALLALLPLLQGDNNPPQAKAKLSSSPYTRKVMVDNQLAAHINEKLKQEGAIKIIEYPSSKTLWRITEEQANSLYTIKTGWVSSGLKFIDQEDKFTRDDGIVFDRSFGAPEPDAPPELRQRKIEGYQYWTVVFAGPGTESWYKTIRDMGIEQIGSARPYGITVWATGKQIEQLEAMVSESSFIQWTGPLHPYYRLYPDLRPGAKPHIRLDSVELVKIRVNLYKHARVGESVAKLQTLYPYLKVHATNIGNRTSMYLELPASQIFTIARFPDLLSISPAWEIEAFDERQGQLLTNNITLGPTSSVPSAPGYLNWLGTKNFSTNPNSYPVVAVVDSGIDNGTLNPAHADFKKFDQSTVSRIINVHNCTSDTEAPLDTTGHGSMIAGIVGAYNNRSNQNNVLIHQDIGGYRRGLGISPYGRLANIKILDSNNKPNFSNCPDGIANVVLAAYNAQAKITNNSWGSSQVLGVYGDEAVNYDIFTRDAVAVVAGNQGMLHVFAMSNAGAKGLKTIANPATAKNVLSVGATEGVRDNDIADGCGFRAASNADNIANFSGRGPTNDGRAKPDLVAPGTHIQSTASQAVGFNGVGVCGGTRTSLNLYYPFPGAAAPQNVTQTLYTWADGTSFSAPVAAGAAQLVYEYYQRALMPGQTPSPAMLKALLINAARYLNGLGSGDDLPSPAQGWGALNLQPIVDNTPRYLLDQSTILTEDSASREYSYYGTIADSNKPFRVTLVWTDPPGDNENISQNNLNLEVTIGGQVYKGNVFRKAFSMPGGEFDTINNVENVFLPEGLSGSFRVKVRTETLRVVGVPGSNTPERNQDFALVVYNATSGATSVVLGQGVVAVSDASPNGNGNGNTEPNELINLLIPIVNNGTSNASNVTSTIAVSGTNAALVGGQSPVNYNTIAPNSLVTPTTPVALRVSPGLPCGSPIVLTQTITYNTNQKQVIGFSLTTGTPRLASAVSYNSSDTPLNIPDYTFPQQGELTENDAGITSTLSINTAGTIGKIKVKLNLTHAYIGDMRLILTSPDGKQVNLVNQRGSGGDNFTNTVFDDEADQSISEGEAPFTGSFKPETKLAALINSPVNGQWKLRIFDEGLGDNGILENWSLEIQPNAGYTCAPYEVTAASIETVSGSNQNVVVTNQFAQPFVVRVKDGSSAALSGVLVTFTAPITNGNNPVASGTFPGSNVTTWSGTTDINGLLTAPTFTANRWAGNYEVQARVAGVATSAKFSLTNNPDAPSQVVVNGNTNQSATVNTAYVPSLKVTVADQYNNPVNSGVNVVFSVVAGSNGASATFPDNAATYNATTNANGLATAQTLTANTTAGSFTVNASVNGINTPATFNLTNMAGPAATIAPVGGNLRVTVVNTNFPGALNVIVKDSYSNLVGNVAVNFAISVTPDSASGTFTGNNNSTSLQTTTNANGQASANFLSCFAARRT